MIGLGIKIKIAKHLQDNYLSPLYFTSILGFRQEKYKIELFMKVSELKNK